MDNDALSGLLNDPEALQNALRSVSSLLGASDAGGAPDAVSPADDPEAQLLPVITGIMQSGRAAVRPEKRALLSALRPFVAEDVASQFDRALRLAGMAGMARAALGQLGTAQKEASILYNRYLAESTPSAAPETPPLSLLLPSLPRTLDRDALITLAAAFFLLTDGDRGTDWESVILAGILLFLGF